MGQAKWKNRLTKKGMIDSPLVETTPFVFKGRLYLLENWRRKWDFGGKVDKEFGRRLLADKVRIRDLETDDIVSTPLIGYGFAIAYVRDGKVYVFAGKFPHNRAWEVVEIIMICSEDLSQWSEPVTVLKANKVERFYNTGVCYDDKNKRFIMLAETDDPAWPVFTFKYYESIDLLNWSLVKDGLYGVDKYVGGPALYFAGGYFYTLYLEKLINGWETRITRSTDLVNWLDAPKNRAVLTFDPRNKVHKIRMADIAENNASDVELCQWQNKTLAYFTGGDQQVGGYLQWAEFNGSLRECLEHYFE